MQIEGVEQSTIVITGMHRSGTSLTAALCQNAGVDVGKRLMKAHESNPKGFYENLDFVDFHRKVLQSQGINDAGYTLQEKIDVEEHYRDEAKKIISENSQSHIWGWKDPRTTLFIDFWVDLLPNACFLLIYRSPWEVIDSLYRRGTDRLILNHPDLAVKVWSNYNQKILEFSEKFPERCHLSSIYQITENTELFIDTINEKFNINLSVPSLEIYDLSLLHKKIPNVSGATLVNHYFPEAIEIYRELELKTNRMDQTGSESWEKEINSSLSRVNAFQNWLAVRNLEKEYKIVQSQLEQTQTQLEQVKTERQQTQTQLEQVKTERQQTAAQLEQTVAPLEQVKSEFQQTQTQLEQVKTERQQTQTQLKLIQKEHFQSLEKLNNVIEQFDCLVTSMVESNRWKIGNLLYSIYRKILLKPLEASPQELQQRLLNKFQKSNRNLNNVKSNSKQYQSVEYLIDLIQQFDCLVTSMVKSNRWKIGNLLYSIYRKILLKPLDPSPQEHQQRLLNKFQKSNRNLSNTQSNFEKYEISENLINVIEEFDRLVTAMVESSRWKIGNLLYSIYRKILLKPLDPPPQEHQQRLLNDFQIWRHNFRNENVLGKAKDNLKHPENNFFSNNNNNKLFRRFSSNSLVSNALSVDIIVCVHNALGDVKSCLNSIQHNTARAYTLFIVNDGSDQKTTDYLRDFSSKRKHCVLLENSTAQGYTKAANKGLRASKSDYVILLNSDTIVPELWIERLLECAESDSRIGIVGPLSNAASWQSVPDLFDQKGDWAINSLPEGFSTDKFAEIVNAASEKLFPRVPFINGFCFLIKKTLIETIGYLDEESFPRGYGEENDYCLRAVNAGFELAIADHAYVYHSKSKSYGHKNRQALSQAGGKALGKKHGNRRIKNHIQELRNNQVLETIRQNLKQYKENIHFNENELLAGGRFGVLFLLPVRGGGGGTHSVVQEAMGMRKMGVNAQIAIKHSNQLDFQSNYPSLCQTNQLFYFYKDTNDLVEYSSQFQTVIATVFHSIKLLQQIIEKHPLILPAYYIQDYEPWFFKKNSEDWKLAYKSYSLIPGTVCFAKTKWLCEIVEQEHHIKVKKVIPSLDQSVYFSDFDKPKGNFPIMVAAMIRPSTPRRGAKRTWRIFKKLKQQFNERVEIHIFGCDDEDRDFQEFDKNFDFQNHGYLIREKVANLLRQVDIFIDLSDYQAFGRTGLEAMACGCAVILPVKGGTVEYAVHEENAILVDTESEDFCYQAVAELLSDLDLIKKLKNNALLKSTEYSASRSSISELTVLMNAWQEQNHKKLLPQNSLTKGLEIDKQNLISIVAIVPKSSAGNIPGSSYIRLLLPLEHYSITKSINLSLVTLNDFHRTNTLPKADIIVIQRTAIPDVETAHKLVKYYQQAGIPILYELDDNLFAIPSNHTEAGKYKKLGEAAKVVAMNSDIVTVPSKKLKETIVKLNPNIQVVPNVLDDRLWITSSRQDNFSSVNQKKIRILYMGTRTHLNDLQVVEDAIKRILKEFEDKVIFDVIGITPNSYNQKWFNPISVPQSNYLEFVEWLLQKNCWDIGIAPLENTDFNKCKSYLKYLDYSALGLATICSDIEPYREVVQNEINGLLTPNSTESWYQAIKCLIEDEALRTKLRKNAYQNLVHNHTLKTEAKIWLDIYKRIATNLSNK